MCQIGKYQKHPQLIFAWFHRLHCSKPITLSGSTHGFSSPCSCGLPSRYQQQTRGGKQKRGGERQKRKKRQKRKSSQRAPSLPTISGGQKWNSQEPAPFSSMFSISRAFSPSILSHSSLPAGDDDEFCLFKMLKMLILVVIMFRKAILTNMCLSLDIFCTHPK